MRPGGEIGSLACPPPATTHFPAIDEGRRSRSFKEVVANNKQPFAGVKLRRIEGINEDLVEILSDDVSAACSHWSSALVGLVPGAKISFAAMERFVESRWSDVAKPKIVQNREGIFLLRFDSRSDAEKIRDGGPWIFGGLRPILLK